MKSAYNDLITERDMYKAQLHSKQKEHSSETEFLRAELAQL